MASLNGSKDGAPAPAAIAPPPALVNRIKDRAAWQAARDACRVDPGRFHGDIASREIHWFEPTLGAHGAWIRRDDDNRWRGYDAVTGSIVEPTLADDYRPWHTAFDDSTAPFYRWFDGALTNACFNEVDRHVLAGHGDEAALWFESDRWDQSQDGGRGAPVV